MLPTMTPCGSAVPDYQASGLLPANTTVASMIDDQWRNPRSCPNRERRP